MVDPDPDSKTDAPASPQDNRDDRGYYFGKIGSAAEHRTVGDYRAWCYDCGEWCYPSSPCGEPKCCAEVSSPTAPVPEATACEQAERWISDAVLALQSVTVISQRMWRTGQVEGLDTGNHDRLTREADEILAALRGAR